MKQGYLVLVLFLLTSCTSAERKNQLSETTKSDTITQNQKYSTDKELDYIGVRDNYINHFRKLIDPVITDSLNKLDKVAVSDLEKRLFEIMKESQYSSQGKINLITLLPYADFGLMDGLSFEKDSLRIVYTSKKLFLDFFKSNNIKNLEELTPQNLAHIFSGAFITDARAYNLSSIKLSSKKDIQIYGMIGAGTNGFGPILPDNLYVLVSKSNFIYMAQKELKHFKEIEGCKTLWDSLWSDYEKKQETNTENKGIDPIEEMMKKYCDCYQSELKNDSQYKTMLKEIEKIAEFLEK